MNDNFDSRKKFLAKFGSYDHVKNLIGGEYDDHIARNPDLHKDFSDVLVNHPNRFVRASIATYSPHKEHLDKLMNDPEVIVAGRVSRNPNASSEHLDRAIYDFGIFHSNVRHKNITKKHLEFIKNNSKLSRTQEIAINRLESGDHK